MIVKHDNNNKSKAQQCERSPLTEMDSNCCWSSERDKLRIQRWGRNLTLNTEDNGECWREALKVSGLGKMDMDL